MAGVEIYNVRIGDNLRKIARDVLGDLDLWPEIARLNNLVDPYTIYPNQALVLPATTVAGPLLVPTPIRATPPISAEYPTAEPSVAGFLAGVKPVVYYAAAAVLLFVLLGGKK